MFNAIFRLVWETYYRFWTISEVDHDGWTAVGVYSLWQHELYTRHSDRVGIKAYQWRKQINFNCVSSSNNNNDDL